MLQLAKTSGQSFDQILTRFALEQLLFWLSQSPHIDRFVLKGATLMMSSFDNPQRATRDLDLLCFGDPSPDPMLESFRDSGARVRRWRYVRPRYTACGSYARGIGLWWAQAAGDRFGPAAARFICRSSSAITTAS
nr:nucleotidyl transferase AbiEii/AbiGii toxin family protein [Rhizobium leguminosarum]